MMVCQVCRRLYVLFGNTHAFVPVPALKTIDQMYFKNAPVFHTQVMLIQLTTSYLVLLLPLGEAVST